MRRAASFYATLVTTTIVVVAIATLLTLALYNVAPINELLRALHVPMACSPIPHVYTLLNTSASVRILDASVREASLFIERSGSNNVAVIVEDRGGCNNGVHAVVEKGVLRLRIEASGCCTVVVKLPVRRYNASIDLAAATLRIEGMDLENLILTASASATKVLSSTIGSAAIDLSASALKMVNTSILSRLSITASASAAKLVLSNRGASIVVEKSVASGVTSMCREAPKPAISIKASASGIDITCLGS